MLQQYVQKYTIVHFVKPQNISTNFSALEWPLHVTLLDLFKTSWPLEDLLNTLDLVASQTAPFTIHPAGQALFGPNEDIHVTLIRPDDGIIEIHNKLFAMSNNASFTHDSPQYIGSGFKPHAAEKNGNKLRLGQTYYVNNFSLVDMFPAGDHMRRSIIKTFQLRA